MSRPADKDSLLSQSQEGFEKLMALISSLSEEEQCKPGVNGEWSVKDVLARPHAFAAD